VGDPKDAKHFRSVLGHFPTGVAVITGIDPDGNPAGMAVGSFTSVSLDPPMVAFLPDKSSTSWPRIEPAGSFCVNILGAEQEAVCRTFAQKGGDKFADLVWRPAGSGAPVLDGVLAWIDCDLGPVYEAGDHYIVLGKVRDLEIGTPAAPLVFFQGGYGRFHSLSLAAGESDLVLQMRTADLARPHMEALATELDVECVASVVVAGEMVLVARAGTLHSEVSPTAVGQRIPFEPPMGTVFVAWADAAAKKVWLDRLPKSSPAETVEALERALGDVREDGYSVARGARWHQQAAQILMRDEPGAAHERTTAEMHELIAALPPDYESPRSADPDDVQTISTPVFGPGGVVTLVLTVIAPGGGPLGPKLPLAVERVKAAAAAVSASLGGPAP
jgi:flavin reductase (DIM6/NTAB) family NADH-FMN oxidoreductase RutF/DNA-binding IclR family transcriptional regulator